MKSKHKLQTERLCLETPSWRDALLVFRLIGNDEVRQHLGGRIPIRRWPFVVRSYLKTDEGEFVWILRVKCSALSIGLMSVTRHKDGGDFELSYQILPEAWHRGYAFEAAVAVLRFMGREKNLSRLIAETRVENLPSCRLLEKLGMTQQERLLRFGAQQAIYVADLRSHVAVHGPNS